MLVMELLLVEQTLLIITPVQKLRPEFCFSLDVAIATALISVLGLGIPCD